jgi:hypothetical protein
MVKLRKAALALGLVCGLAGTALAASSAVQVFGNWARGDLGAAHNSAGAQYVGCWVNSDPVGPPLLYCEANDGTGNVNFCYTSNANMVSVAATIQSSSEISFGWDTATHACAWFTVNNFSQSPGRKP